MKIVLLSSLRNRRGTLLVAAMFLIPLALIGYLAALTQVDVALAETKRHHQRVQARLLAESALAVARNKSQGAAETKGSIDGVGEYSLKLQKAVEGNSKLMTQGRIAEAAADGLTVECVIEGEFNSALKSYNLHGISYRIEPGVGTHEDAQ